MGRRSEGGTVDERTSGTSLEVHALTMVGMRERSVVVLGRSSIVAGVRVVVMQRRCRCRRWRRSPLELSRRGVLLLGRRRRSWSWLDEASVGGVVVRVAVSRRRRVPWMSSIVVLCRDAKVGVRTPAVRPPDPSSLDDLPSQCTVASLSSSNGRLVRRHPRDAQPLRLVTPPLHRLSVVSPSTRRWKFIRRSRLPAVMRSGARNGVLRM